MLEYFIQGIKEHLSFDTILVPIGEVFFKCKTEIILPSLTPSFVWKH